MGTIDKWLKSAATCQQQPRCRLEDRPLNRHLAEWVNRDRLSFPPDKLGSYPGFVGPNYGASNPKILFVAVNPGRYSDVKWPLQRERLRKYKEGESADEIFQWETEQIWSWGRNAKWRALFEGANLNDWNDVAFTNVCLCPTHNDTTPRRSVIRRCVNTHLVGLVTLIKPDVVLFLAMSNQESVFDPAREVLDRFQVGHRTVPHPARRGVGQTAAYIRSQIAKAVSAGAFLERGPVKTPRVQQSKAPVVSRKSKSSRTGGHIPARVPLTENCEVRISQKTARYYGLEVYCDGVKIGEYERSIEREVFRKIGEIEVAFKKLRRIYQRSGEWKVRWNKERREKVITVNGMEIDTLERKYWGRPNRS